MGGTRGPTRGSTGGCWAGARGVNAAATATADALRQARRGLSGAAGEMTGAFAAARPTFIAGNFRDGVVGVQRHATASGTWLSSASACATTLRFEDFCETIPLDCEGAATSESTRASRKRATTCPSPAMSGGGDTVSFERMGTGAAGMNSLTRSELDADTVEGESGWKGPG